MTINQALVSEGPQVNTDNNFVSRYTRVAIILHWTIAALIIFNLVLGLILENFQGPARFIPITLHISAGLSVLALTVLRIIWRIMNPAPAFPDDMKTWERNAAHFAHFFLYLVMVVVPLTGWMLVSANPPSGSAGYEYRKEMMMKSMPKPAPDAQNLSQVKQLPAIPPTIQAWFFIPVPYIDALSQLGAEPEGLASQKILHDEIIDWHMVTSYLTIFLLLLHVLAALKHQFIDKQAEMQRMGIGPVRAKH